MIGTKLAHYEIISHLGSGGMGEVYQATDSKLGRSVAIKLLPEAFALDSDRLARFEREARLLASLNHANIAHIHGLDDAGGRTFLVMELVPGETLGERIARGPIQVDETLVLVRQIADALEAAHEQGIVHRDLKPANIKVTPQGQIKVLDFGLAKAFAGEAAAANLSHSPTLSLAATQAGTILGTAAYMSPEQAKGKATDRRTDVWAFGCVLYEMLTGRAAFEGDTLGEILGSVFRAEPDWKKLPDATPSAVRRLLERCLKKDPSLRLHDIADARLDILDAQNGSEATAPPTSSASRRERLAWMALAAALVTAASLAASYALRPAPAAPEMRLDMTTPAGNLADLAFSPDGERVAFIGTSSGVSQIWLRSIRSGEAQPLAGTENGSAPFWSPDGASVGFTAGGKLKSADATTGAVATISDASRYESGGSWNTDGVILFAPSTNAPLFRVPAAGGSPEPVTRLKRGMETGHFEPFFLPDGNHFLFRVATNSDEQEIHVADLNGSEPRRLVAADRAVYAAGQLYFVRSGKLFAQPFDASSQTLGDAPVELAENLAERGLSVSPSGAIAYRTSGGDQQFQFAWFDRSGREVQKLGVLDAVYRGDPRLSPDGSRVMFTRVLTSGHADIWMMDTARGNAARVTTDPADDILSVWSRDGTRIAFTSARKGNGGNAIYWKALVGASGSEELLLDNGGRNAPSSWSPDGRVIAYTAAGAKTNLDIWALPVGDGRKPFVLAQTPFSEANAQFSPAGKWIAYESDESGRQEIYVQPFPGPANKLPASTDGGTAVQWRDDGKELYFRGQDGRFMAVAVQLDANGKDIHLGVPAPLFALPDGVGFNGYSVTRDGQRFLVDTTIDPPLSAIHLILNWKKPGT